MVQKFFILGDTFLGKWPNVKNTKKKLDTLFLIFFKFCLVFRNLHEK